MYKHCFNSKFSFSIFILSLFVIAQCQDFIPDFNKNADGTGGVPPPIKHYLGVWGESGTNGVPGDAHAVHGLVTSDGMGYIVCGKGDEQGDEKRDSSIAMSVTWKSPFISTFKAPEAAIPSQLRDFISF